MASLDVFLTKKEQKTIQSLYVTWLDNIDPKPLADKLFAAGLMTKTNKSTYEAKPEIRDRAACLFDMFLIRGTYEQLSQVRQLMIELGTDSSYLQMAKSLPTRGEDIDFSVPSVPSSHSLSSFPITETSASLGDQSCKSMASDGIHSSSSDGGSTTPSVFGDTKSPSSYINLPSGSDTEAMPDTVAESAGVLRYLRKGIEFLKIGSSSSEHVKQLAMSQSEYSIKDDPVSKSKEPRQSLLDCYGFKPLTWPSNNVPINRLKFGKGLCVIVTNFTDDLTGYNDDAHNLTAFFGNTLGYSVKVKSDLRRAEVVDFLEEIQTELDGNSEYDRLFLFILSHGDENGIKCCVPAPEEEHKKMFVEEVDESAPHGGKLMVDDVINMFVHTRDPDKQDSLKSYPKCFFFQICQGEQSAKGAAVASPIGESPQFEPLPTDVKVSENADTMVSYASVKGTKSWVESDGSVFIKNIMRVFKEYQEDEHLADMMVEVNRRVSRAVLKGEIEGQGTRRVHQMPETVNRLTMKMYLSIPEDILVKQISSTKLENGEFRITWQARNDLDFA